MGNSYGSNQWDEDSYPQDGLYHGQDTRGYGQTYQNPQPPAPPMMPGVPGQGGPRKSLALPILGALAGVLVIGGGIVMGSWYLLKDDDAKTSASSQTSLQDSDPGEGHAGGSVPSSQPLPVSATPIDSPDKVWVTPASITGRCPDGSSSAPNGVDDSGRTTTFGPSNAIDSDSETAWRCPGAGGGELRFQMAEPTEVLDFGLIPGYAKRDPATGKDRFYQNHTVTEASWTFDLADGGQLTITQQIGSPSPDGNYMRLSQPQKIVGGTMRVTGTGNPGAERKFTPVSSLVVSNTDQWSGE